jgi:hypothetical protein
MRIVYPINKMSLQRILRDIRDFADGLSGGECTPAMSRLAHAIIICGIIYKFYTETSPDSTGHVVVEQLTYPQSGIRTAEFALTMLRERGYSGAEKIWNFIVQDPNVSTWSLMYDASMSFGSTYLLYRTFQDYMSYHMKVCLFLETLRAEIRQRECAVA